MKTPKPPVRCSFSKAQAAVRAAKAKRRRPPTERRYDPDVPTTMNPNIDPNDWRPR